MDRQMFAVDATCAKCGAHISELPFQPSGDRPVYCSTCNREFRDRNRDDRGGSSRGGFANRGPKKMFDVDVVCAGCGAKITQLPFMPSGNKPIYCRDCMRSQRA